MDFLFLPDRLEAYRLPHFFLKKTVHVKHDPVPALLWQGRSVIYHFLCKDILGDTTGFHKKITKQAISLNSVLQEFYITLLLSNLSALIKADNHNTWKCLSYKIADTTQQKIE